MIVSYYLLYGYKIPALVLNVTAIFTAKATISSSKKPLVVTAGVPRRIPLGLNGGSGSSGTTFALTVIPARSSMS